jgi:hypothetical protein
MTATSPNPSDTWWRLIPTALTGSVHLLLLGPTHLRRAIEAGEETVYQRRERNICLELLHLQYDQWAPEVAADHLGAVWGNRRPFVLYLRSFTLGSRLAWSLLQVAANRLGGQSPQPGQSGLGRNQMTSDTDRWGRTARILGVRFFTHLQYNAAHLLGVGGVLAFGSAIGPT